MFRWAGALVCVALGACSSTGGGTTGGGNGASSGGNGGGSSTAAASSGGGGGTSQGQSSSETGPIICPAPSSTSAMSMSSSGGSGAVGSSGSSSLPPWDCLGTVCWGAPMVAEAPITVRAVDYLQSTNVPDITVKLCGENDSDCTTPVATVTTDSLGYADLTIPLHPWHGFRGHLELTGANKVPTIVHLNPPIVGNTPQWTVGVFNLDQLDLVARLAGADELKPSRGHVGALVENCNGDPASGVTFHLENVDEFTSWAYLVNNIPDSTATQTDRNGAVGFFNARPGVTRLTASRVAGGQFVGSVPVLIRAGWVTTLVVPPSPMP